MKFKTSILIFLGAIMCFWGETYGQSKKTKTKKYTISGYIKEFGSQEDLPMVTVYVPNKNLGTSTNDYGFYSLTLPEGEYELVISYVGYTSQKKTIQLQKNLKLNFQMEVSAEVLEEVIVNANKEVKESQQAQMSILRLKTKDVKEVPAIFGEKDVIKTLQLLPGIQRGNEGTSSFFVRGGTPDQNLIILDDAPVYNSNHLFGFLSVFNGDAIKSIEMYKGGFPARFGGRLSSVLKIDTKSGNKEALKGKVSAGLVSTSVVLEGPINKGKTSFLFSGRRTYLDLLFQLFDESSSSPLFNFTDFNFKIHHVFNDKNKLYWSNYYGNDHLSLSESTDLINDRSSLDWGNITSTLRWNHEFSDKFFSNTSFIYSNYNLEVENEYTTENQENVFNLNTGINDFGLKMDFDYYPNPKHFLKFGFSSTYHHFTPRQSRLERSSGDNTAFKQNIKSLESALYAEDDWKLSNSLRFSGGFRFSHYKHGSKTYKNFEPRATLAWKVQPDLAVKASYANMNQYIHLLTNANAGLPTDIWVSSTENLKPQKSEQFALGIAKDFVDKGYALTLEGYYKKMDNIISYKEGASFIALENSINAKEINWEENITSGQGWAYGTELLFRKNIGKVTGWLGYTLSWSERQFDEINRGKRFFAKYDRRHDISLVGVYKPSKNIVLSGSWVFSSGNNFNLLDREASTGLDNFLIPNGYYNSVQPFLTERNNFQGESYHRLDLGIQLHKKLSNNTSRFWEISVYNAYGRKNPFYYHYDYSENKLMKRTFLQFVPSISYTYKF